MFQQAWYKKKRVPGTLIRIISEVKASMSGQRY